MKDADPPRQLFVVYLGGNPAPGSPQRRPRSRPGVADGVVAARRAALDRWAGTTRPHVDGVRTVAIVNGYRVSLEQTDERDTSDINDTFDPGDS